MWQYNYTPSSDELYHYGVLGMKWGNRKGASYYEGKAQKSISKMNYSGTRLGKNLHNYAAFRNELRANQKKAQAGETRVLRKIDNRYGHGAMAANQKAAANYYNRAASYNIGKKKTRYQSYAYNNASAAKANESLHNAKSVRDFGKKYVDAMFNRKIKTVAGRTTTTGKAMVDNLLTFGIGGKIKDIQYRRSQRKW